MLRVAAVGLAMLAAAAGASNLVEGIPATHAGPPLPAEAGLLSQVARSVVTVTAVAADGSTTLGSGFFAGEDGRLLTSAHVVEHAAAVTVTDADGTRVEASRVAVDPALDVAELAVSTAAPPPLPLAAAAPGAGAQVYVAGNPGGESPGSVALGRVTAVHARARTVGGHVYPDLLATDASSAPGTSGGPVVDVRGRVVGMVAAGDPRSLDTLAIPVERFRPMLATWATIEPPAFVPSRPVAGVGHWGGVCDVTHCSATADVANRGVSGRLVARFEFWVGSRQVAACADTRMLAAGESATLTCAVPVDLAAAAGKTYTVTEPAISAG